ncbi:hypothetical protein E5340_05505 [Ligilactobacillus murinus]|uniref:Uncharacterized protein n=1 Tax=Ligilactobacillus murinus TaxID=1622 RepID=A0A4S2EMC3_9LACO|nr:hypothetical protein [Ligilactobacillus murinus]TGY55464.1 hypothetical protein E5340_05505 [Ligilactobacillus murinus]
MRLDEIDAIESYNDPNSCNSPSEEPLYTITEWDGTELSHQTKVDVVDYVRDELTTTLFRINVQGDDDDHFEVAKEYLEQFSAIMEERL